MIVHFHIHYKTRFGEHVNVIVQRNDTNTVVKCQTFDGENWLATLEAQPKEAFSYKYQVETLEGIIEEWGAFRQIKAEETSGTTQLFRQDTWRAQADENNVFFSAAFTEVIFKRKPIADAKKTKPKAVSTKDQNTITFQLHAAALPQHLKFCILGNCDALGNWTTPVIMSDADFPLWTAQITTQATDVQIAYKYAIFDESQSKILVWEEGDDRKAYFTFPATSGNVLHRTDEGFRYPFTRWRGTGVAIPVFSLRSKQGLGIGEFTDLNLLIDWAKATGMKLVQVLPVNDTIATKTWVDSYPYAAISVFALHPLYVNIQAIAPLKDKKLQDKLQKAITSQNQLENIDFEAVLKYKFEFFKALFAQEKANFLKNPDVQHFINNNADWLKPYSAFCYLRDENGTSNFNLWKKHQTFSPAVIEEICNEKAKHFDEVALYYFIQYHAHQQLFGATTYAREQGVVLKGDLPIGIYRYSCDAWVAPELYNMDGQAGAPPDDFAVAGQNWGFPTYNWQEMAKDNFAWWQQRMTKLSEYFDALRIDHILGFFRIWQIPTDQVEGTMGLFNPRMPYSIKELTDIGFRPNLDRYTKPYIRAHYLQHRFGDYTEWVKKEFLNEIHTGIFELKPFCDTQLKIKQICAENPEYAAIKGLDKALYSLVSEVLLIEEPNSNGQAYNPRITLTRTQSYSDLNDFEKYLFQTIYEDYFFKRHDDFWRRQALWKLPALLNATNMLICGEDLGMIPHAVPGVMKALNIISLEIQRMPKGSGEFGQPQQYPYLSVCSPSCHDMSTIRGWWESDGDMAQRFSQQILHWYGGAPQPCSTEVVEAIINQHLESPSMWAIFPIQDLVGMDANLRRAKASDEQINEPANPQHYWRFRFHIALEDLKQQQHLTEKINGMIKRVGR